MGLAILATALGVWALGPPPSGGTVLTILAATFGAGVQKRSAKRVAFAVTPKAALLDSRPCRPNR
jgi:hypothetical protein